MDNFQTETRRGPIVRKGKAALFPASVAEATLLGRFAALDSADGLADLTAADERPDYVVTDFNEADQTLTLQPLTREAQVRVRNSAAGALTPGQLVETAASGEVEVVNAGTARAVVEEGAAASGLVLVRPL